MFIRLATLILVTTLSAACGGGGGNDSSASSTSGTIAISTLPTTSSSSSSSSVSSSSFNASIVWTPTTPAPGQVKAVSPDTNIANGTVITFGQVFAAGEIPSGQVVRATTGSTALATQTDIKRVHSDGSIRHAVLSVQLPAAAVSSPAQASVAFTLASSGTGASGSPLSLSSVNSAGSPVDYRVEITENGLKANGSATDESARTWSTTLKNALANNANSWISGALASEWRARVAPENSGSSHPGLRVIFDARYQSTSQGRVSITIENVESSTGRGNRTYSLNIYNATTGGTAVFSQSGIVHYAHTRYRKVFHFGTDMKDLVAIADIARLKSARAIPNYANISILESTLAAKYASWQTSNRGLYQPARITPNMATTGGREDIGPLPGWTATALLTGDPRMYQIMLDHADRAGMWNVHWRDSLVTGATIANTDVFSIDVHPNFALFNSSSDPSSYVGSTHVNWMGDALPAPSLPFSVPSGWVQDTDHEPSLNYLPYAITGDRFYLDELYFYANWHFMNRQAAYRGYGDGLVKNYQIRGQAWTMRTLGHAAWISPDAHWQKAYFTDKLNKNIAWYRANTLTTNSLGYWAFDDLGWRIDLVPQGSGQVAFVTGPWQNHFMAYTLSQLCDWGYAATDLRDFSLGYSTRLFTSSPDYSPFDGTAYYSPIKLTNGSYINTMADLNYHSFAARTSGPPSVLPGYNSPDGYAAFALVALSAANDAGNTSASAGYVFVRDQIMNPGNGNRVLFVNNPTWNIVARNPVIGLGEAPGIYTK